MQKTLLEIVTAPPEALQEGYRVCPVCGRTFMPLAATGRPQKYDQEKCKFVAYRRRQALRNAPLLAYLQAGQLQELERSDPAVDSWLAECSL